MKASATSRAALRMLPYTQRPTTPQLCCLLLMLAVISLPLNGMPAPRTSSLAPLQTGFAPFDTTIQAPDLTVVQLSVGALPGKRIALAWNATSLPAPQHRDFASYPEPDRYGPSGPVALVTGRSPPLA